MMCGKNKARAGLLLMSAQWFSDIGAEGSGAGRLSGLPALLEQDTGRILDALGRHFDVLFPGRVTTAEEALNAARNFAGAGVDAVILVSLMWSEDGPLVRFLQEIGDIPLILWCYTPFQRLPERVGMQEAFRGSGIVGCLQGSVPLRRMGARFRFVFGCPEDGALGRELSQYASALAARRGMKTLRIGRIGSRCESMTGTWIDDFALSRRLGPSIVPVSYQRLRETADSLREADVDAFVRDLKSRYPVLGVSDRSLAFAARASLAVGRIADEESLGVVSIEDLNPELHRLLKTRPCLWAPGLRERGAVAGMEADVLTAVGLWVLRQFCGHTPMYSEVLTFDPAENVILFGHGAMHDPELAGENQVSVVPDYEYESIDEIEGAWLNFRCRAGRVTMVSLSQEGEKYRLFTFPGEALAAPDETEGFTNAAVKVPVPVSALFEKAVTLGVMQHYAMGYGDFSGELEKFCRLTGMEFICIP